MDVKTSRAVALLVNSPYGAVKSSEDPEFLPTVLKEFEVPSYDDLTDEQKSILELGAKSFEAADKLGKNPNALTISESKALVAKM
jgi:hypothetical protein